MGTRFYPPTRVNSEGLVRKLLEEQFPEYAQDDELVEHLGQLVTSPASATPQQQQDASAEFLRALEKLTGENVNHLGMGGGMLLCSGGIVEMTYGNQGFSGQRGIGELTIRLNFMMKP